MKKLIFLLFVFGVFQHWGEIKNSISPPPDFSAMHHEGVVLYATSWCGYCKKTRDFFTENKIPFMEYDIEKSEEGKAQYNRLQGNGVPLVVIHGKLIAG